MKNILRKPLVNESSIMAFLQIYENYCRLKLFSDFIQTQQEVSYLSWQNTYPNLKTTCYIKLKCFLWTKHLENLLFAKYLISVTVTLNISFIAKMLKFN